MNWKQWWPIILRYGLLAAAGSVLLAALPYTVGNREWFVSSRVNVVLSLLQLAWGIVCALMAVRRWRALHEGRAAFHEALLLTWPVLLLMGTAGILHYWIRMQLRPDQFEWVRQIQLDAWRQKWIAENLSEADIASKTAQFLSDFQPPTFSTALMQWVLWLLISFGLALVVAAFAKTKSR